MKGDDTGEVKGPNDGKQVNDGICQKIVNREMIGLAF